MKRAQRGVIGEREEFIEALREMLGLGPLPQEPRTIPLAPSPSLGYGGGAAEMAAQGVQT